MSRNIVLSKFRGMFTDVEATHIPDNGFSELVNLRIGRDRRLEKIPGYAKYSDYLFDSPINSVEQLKDVNDRNLFMFSNQNIYRRDINDNITILKTDYPITQTEPYDPSSFLKVNTIVGENKIWCVDENVYPFFIYNLSEEGSVNLNVWARIVVEGADTIRVVDANDPTIIYKIITIIPQENDGTNLVVRYNDESNIYIFSDTWGYKFNYSAKQYEIVKKVEISVLPITAISFKDTSFWIEPDNKEYNYDLVNIPQEENTNRFYYESGIILNNISRFYRGGSWGNYQLCVPFWDQITYWGGGYWGLSISHTNGVPNYSFNIESRVQIIMNLKEVYNRDVTIDIDEVAQINYGYVSPAPQGGNLLSGYSDKLGRSCTYWKAYTKRNSIEKRSIILQKGRKLYVGGYTTSNYDYQRIFQIHPYLFLRVYCHHL